MPNFALYAMGGAVLIFAIWYIVGEIRHGGELKERTKNNENMLDAVDEVKRARNDPATRKRVFNKYKRD